MTREKIRLRPTGLWVLFGPILVCMWLAAVNYSNNLIYGILYLIGSLTFISIFHTWRNLASLEVEHVRVRPAFAGDEIAVEIFFRNRANHATYGLFFVRVEERRSIPLSPRGGGVLRVPAEETRTAELFFRAGSRGKFRLDALLVRTSYPFGLVTASFRLPLNVAYFVYPALAGNSLLPELRTGGENGIQSHPKPGDDFAGVRSYVAGESLRHVDWKAYARGRPLSVKQFLGGDEQELWLEASELSGRPLEARLSQLALWVITAEKENIPYGLTWGETTVPLGLGETHARQALEILAEAKR